MRVIAKSTLRRFLESGHSDAKAPLQDWHRIVINAPPASPQPLQTTYGKASLTANGPGSGLRALKHLMQANDLTQKDLPEIGSQGVVSEILTGKRELNVRHIRALAARFKVSPAAFV